MKIVDIDFPDPLRAALRDGKLVVFAGAGVSMGEPSRLPNFPDLAREVAVGTGQTLQNSEPVDRFLGRLQHERSMFMVAPRKHFPRRISSRRSCIGIFCDSLLGSGRFASSPPTLINCSSRHQRMCWIPAPRSSERRHCLWGTISTALSTFMARLAIRAEWCSRTRILAGPI